MGKGLVAFGLAVISLAGGSERVQASTDLATLLPEPPTAGWSPARASPDVLVGSFTAASYAAWLNQGSSSSTTPSADASGLTSLGFVGGYAKEWGQASTNDVLDERVFEFGSPSGADSWYAGIKQATLKLSSYKSEISGASAIPSAFGAVLSYTDGDQWRVDFREANLVFIVHANSYAKGEDLSNLALGQAELIYTIAQSSPSPIRTWDRGLLVVGGVVIGAVVVITTLVFIILVLTRPWQRAALAVNQQGPLLSPDGHYWWDGAAWRPTNPENPSA